MTRKSKFADGDSDDLDFEDGDDVHFRDDDDGVPRGNISDNAREKWGAAIDAGFQMVPDLLLRHQRQLKLTATDLIVILNFTAFWWYANRLPYARTQTVARRMGTDVRTVQRSLRKLELLGYVRRLSASLNAPRLLDFGGLARALAALATHDPNYWIRKQSRSNELAAPVSTAGGRARPSVQQLPRRSSGSKPD